MRPSEVIGMKRAGFSVNLLFVPQKEGLLIASFYQHHNNYFTLRWYTENFLVFFIITDCRFRKVLQKVKLECFCKFVT